MDNKKLMTGNQAIARGFYEAGGHVATSYPGSPTVEIIDTIKRHHKAGYAEFSVNEKVALEVGIGSSMAGARTLVAMKHVGVNIAADPLMTFTQTKTKGGFILVSGDDPGMASSQNEQDNRLFAKFANMPVLDPSTSQEAKEMTKLGFEISEKYETPVMLRITSRLCHSRSHVFIEDRIEHSIKGFERDISNFGMIPPYTFDKQYHMKDRILALQKDLEQDAISPNRYEALEDSKVLIITSGLVYEHYKALELPYSVYKLGMVYPLPIEAIRKLSKTYESIAVIEEMMPFIEDQLKLAGIECCGKEYFSFTGELDIQDIRAGFEKANLLKNDLSHHALHSHDQTSEEVIGRLPMFCAGCPHRPVFDILKKSKKNVIGDIGCYSMGILYPLEVLDTVISMGASIGMMKGISKAHQLANKNEPLVAVIGDGTFYHSGMTGLVNLLHQLDPEENMTLIILNNATTAMTGGQPTASSGVYNQSDDMHVDMPKLIEAMGFERVKVVDQFFYKEAKQIIDGELAYKGLSIVITTRPYVLKYKIKEPSYYVDPSICIGCRSCVKTNCPPIHMKAYEGIDKLKSSIDPSMCVGCSVCSQVCPVNAIKSTREEA